MRQQAKGSSGQALQSVGRASSKDQRQKAQSLRNKGVGCTAGTGLKRRIMIGDKGRQGYFELNVLVLSISWSFLCLLKSYLSLKAYLLHLPPWTLQISLCWKRCSLLPGSRGLWSIPYLSKALHTFYLILFFFRMILKLHCKYLEGRDHILLISGFPVTLT